MKIILILLAVMLSGIQTYARPSLEELRQEERKKAQKKKASDTKSIQAEREQIEKQQKKGAKIENKELDKMLAVEEKEQVRLEVQLEEAQKKTLRTDPPFKGAFIDLQSLGISYSDASLLKTHFLERKDCSKYTDIKEELAVKNNYYVPERVFGGKTRSESLMKWQELCPGHEASDSAANAEKFKKICDDAVFKKVGKDVAKGVSLSKHCQEIMFSIPDKAKDKKINDDAVAELKVKLEKQKKVVEDLNSRFQKNETILNPEKAGAR